MNFYFIRISSLVKMFVRSTDLDCFRKCLGVTAGESIEERSYDESDEELKEQWSEQLCSVSVGPIYYGPKFWSRQSCLC